MPRSWTVPALGVAAVLLFGYVGTHRFHAEPPAPAPPSATAADPGLPELTGDRGPGPDGLKVLVGGRYPQLVDARTGHSGPVPGLRFGPGERVALRTAPGGTLATITPQGAGDPRTELLTPTGTAVPVADRGTVLPAYRGRVLYVTTYDATDTTVRLAGTSTSWTVPGRLTPLGDTPYGLVVAQVGDVQGALLRLLDPRTGHERRRLASGRIALAVGRTAVAHLSGSCTEDCRVTVTRLADGASRDYTLPNAIGNPSTAVFSPDGRFLALGVPGQYLDGRLYTLPGYSQILDLADGRLLGVPGLSTAAEHAAVLSWSGDTLVLGVWSAQRGNLAVWSPDHPGPLRILPVDLPGDETYGTATAE